MTEDSRKIVQPSDRLAPRKPYLKPELRTYGDIRQITQAIGKRGNLDGVMSKTTH